MKIKNKKKSIFKRILAFGGALLCAFAFCFGIFNISNNHNETLQVSADEVISSSYEYLSSGIVFPTFVMNNDNGVNSYFGFTSSLFRFILTDQGSDVKFFPASSGYYPGYGVFAGSGTLSSPEHSILVPKNNVYQFQDVIVTVGQVRDDSISNYRNVYKYASCFVYCSTNFDCNVNSIYISSSIHDPLPSFNISWIEDYNYVKFIDKNGNYFIFGCSLTPFEGVVLQDFDPLLIAYNSRLYYLSADFSDNEYYNQGYTTGHYEGYDEGYLKGEERGYDDGYNTGKNDGYNLGYNTAIGNDRYSFDSLLSAVIDVPVRTFTSLFNFEILGVNLSGFFLGLLTCCIVVAIVRFIL